MLCQISVIVKYRYCHKKSMLFNQDVHEYEIETNVIGNSQN